MAKKTDAEIGAEIRAKVAEIALETYETIDNVKIIVSVGVTDDREKSYSKGSKGLVFAKYDADDEEINNSW